MEMHSRGTQDGRLEPEVPQRHPADWGKGRRNTAPSRRYVDRPRPRLDLLQHSGLGVAGGEGEAGNHARAENCVKECLSQFRR